MQTGRMKMNSRIAILGIIIDNPDVTAQVNEILHENADYIVGRMGIPYRSRDLNIISIVIDAPADVINSMAGRIGRLNGVSAKTIYSKN
jgi:putative iron-only hydrogenase system regulator